MSSIIEGSLAQFDEALADYARVFQEPTEFIKQREQELREQGGVIHSFDTSSCLEDKTLVAVDGGRASEQLSGGDIIVAAATLADGISSKLCYGDTSISETVLAIVPHTSTNDSSLGARIMASLELRVLERAGTDHIIIDGAYLGNTSEVLFGLVSGNEETTKRLLHANEDGKLQNALTRILNVSPETSTQIIAVPKSDSSYVQSKTYLGETPLSSQVSDRMLATRLLDPGEFLVPRALQTNPYLLSALQKAEKTGFEGLSKDSKALLHQKLEQLANLGGGWDKTRPDKLYTAYFKPSGWHRADRALKVEFVSLDTSDEGVLEQARKVIQVVNSDTVDNAIMEPYSQYVADIRAKEVGTVIDILKQRLVAEANGVDELNGLIRNYRT